MQSAAIDSSTTIINPDPGLDLVRLTDGQPETACYMLQLHVTLADMVMSCQVRC